MPRRNKNARSVNRNQRLTVKSTPKPESYVIFRNIRKLKVDNISPGRPVCVVDYVERVV